MKNEPTPLLLQNNCCPKGNVKENIFRQAKDFGLFSKKFVF